MSDTTVKPCKCKNDYQDKRYGVQERLMNVADKKRIGNNPQLSCTVCGTKHS